MKLLYTLIIVFSSGSIFAQVGIGTTTPLADLHVVGDALVQGGLVTTNLTTVSSSEENFKLVTRITNSTPAGKITILDPDYMDVAPINTVNYHFVNVHLDNLSDVNLMYDEDKYVVGVANFRHVGDAIKKVPGGDNYSIGHFVVRTFKSGGTWHLEISNKELDLNILDSLEYHITLIIYNKLYFREFPSITTNLGGSNTGTASSVPIFE
ncbi:hypothetical protein ATE92_0741 [Ulvibacter sp. MAR_2010_11]|uniref:hypothetical protein n=1 Tax=Ulvibacter sp. MAR_2010_11 TaxID=1250229 RepID=UPI000C2C4180|nr:hypothetical protein [Ulvibacter sp. MAR_2010_11]PKA82608.1 hypothetical protein ATE92_0741 [Ulvibacter sp. MAR_2010_11]